MNFSNLSSVASRPSPSFDQQPVRTGKCEKSKNKGPVSGQGRLVQRDESPSLQVATRSPLDVDDRFRRRPVSLLQRTTTESPAAPESGDMNLYFEAGDITIHDVQFSETEIGILQQLFKSYSDVKKLNNPVIDRSEQAERARHFYFDCFLNLGIGLVVLTFLVSFNMIFDYFIDNKFANGPEDAALMKKRKYEVHAVLPLFLMSLAVGILATPFVAELSRIPTSFVTTMVDRREKRLARTNENATDQFLKKYNRMETLLGRLCKLRTSEYVTGSSNHSFRDLPPSTDEDGIDSGIDSKGGKPIRERSLAESSMPHALDREDLSFYFSRSEENRVELEKAIAETKEWLERAERQIQLIRNDSTHNASG